MSIFINNNRAEVTDTGHIKGYFTDEKGAMWHYDRFSVAGVGPGASGATEAAENATRYWLLNAITEFLYFNADIHEDWDGDSDLVVAAYVALDGAETANDLINATLVVDYYAEHDNMTTGRKTQTRSVDHDIVALNAAGSVHKLVFVINWDEGGNVMQVDDLIAFRFYLDSVASVAAVRFLYADFKYRTKYALRPFVSMPSEG